MFLKTKLSISQVDYCIYFFQCGMWDLIVLVPDLYLLFNSTLKLQIKWKGLLTLLCSKMNNDMRKCFNFICLYLSDKNNCKECHL